MIYQNGLKFWLIYQKSDYSGSSMIYYKSGIQDFLPDLLETMITNEDSS